MKTTRKENKRYFENYIAKKNNENPFIIPTQGIDSGAYGKSFESTIKYLFGNTNGKTVSAQNTTDTVIKINGKKTRIEIKTGGGVIVNANGKNCLDKCDYFIYCPRYNPNENINTQCIVYNANEIKAFLFNPLNKCLRTKRTTNGKTVISIVSSKQAFERVFYADIDYLSLFDFMELFDKNKK